MLSKEQSVREVTIVVPEGVHNISHRLNLIGQDGITLQGAPGAFINVFDDGQLLVPLRFDLINIDVKCNNCSEPFLKSS